VILGEAVFFESIGILLYAVFMWIFFHLSVVYHEESKLKEKFGEAYRKYVETVQRWLPRVF
jgi:protein-S-isoprenylcysteine O-methyltransferase Ste14